MKNSKLLLLLLFLLPLGACIFDNDDIDEKTYLFIERYTDVDGVLVSGPEPPSLQIDFPTYRYDEDLKTLNGIIDFEINDELKFIYGGGTCLTGTAGGGCASGLTGVYAVPFEHESFELLKIEEDGTIRFIYDDDVFSLGVNEKHVVVTSYMDTTDVDGTNSISEITSTHTISNFGFINKEDIILWEW
ncbi:hypothetical protein SLH46_06640 [Draconibacterium sp. IB214405]|uniref:hypothetical protein n=1 Tax=Draconibacterium sp. IB214405 TaxID=3097352 RepID=UPI002A0B0A0E|nr:hypothetical protein [Draconibacterium sp. IB214405]MDX8338851.1 hypothetical protein [Draconibacterium sp. IB214405]